MLLFFHLVLTLQEKFCYSWQCLIDVQLSKPTFFNLISCKLLSTTTGTPIVLIASSGRLNHPELRSFQMIPSAHDHGCSKGSEVGIDRLHLELHRQSICERRAWDFDAKHLLILLCFFPASVHHGSTIRHKTIDNLLKERINEQLLVEIILEKFSCLIVDFQGHLHIQLP